MTSDGVGDIVKDQGNEFLAAFTQFLSRERGDFPILTENGVKRRGHRRIFRHLFVGKPSQVISMTYGVIAGAETAENAAGRARIAGFA